MIVIHLWYGVLLLLAPLVSGAVALLTAQRARSMPSAWPLVVFLLALFWWSGTYALHWLPVPRPHPFFWLDLTFVGVVGVPGAFLAFALRFTHHDRPLAAWIVALLAVEPLLTLLFLFTDPGTGLFFAGTRAAAAVEGAIQTGGPIFWCNLIYSYTLMLVGLGLLVREFQRSPLYRRQVGTMLVGLLITWAINIASITPLNPFTELDPTSFSFTIAGVALAYSLFRYRLLDVVPVARHVLVERMGDGVLVLDAQHRIGDANPAMGRLLGVQPATLIGRPVTAVLAQWAELLTTSLADDEATGELVLDGPIFLEVHVSLLRDRHGHVTGQLIVARDIGERKRAELALRAVNTQLCVQLQQNKHLQEQLRDQALRDALTGLWNRRSIEATLVRAVAEARRDGQPLSLVTLDVDHFKRVNDTYGHPTGDVVLRALGQLLLGNIRCGDTASRFGGEEFVVLLPGTTKDQAAARAEGWRAAWAAQEVRDRDAIVQTTVSIGIATYPNHGVTAPELLRAADRALYRAKAQGRNQVVVGSTAAPHVGIVDLAA